MIKLVSNNCSLCGKLFNSTRLSKFCSKSCANKSWYSNNKEHRLDKNRSYRQNSDVKAELAKKARDWFSKNPEKIKEYKIKNREKVANVKKQKYKDDINFRLLSALRSHHGRTIRDIRNSKINSASLNELGCSIEELKFYIESKFQFGMNWDNWGRGSDRWHLDHIKPLSKFDLSDPIEYKKACHYTNLQPLWEKQNLSKGAKYG
jgi:hypothetical protein